MSVMLELMNRNSKATHGRGWQCWDCVNVPGYTGYATRREALLGAVAHRDKSHPGDSIRWRKPRRVWDALAWAIIRVREPHGSGQHESA